ncbi:NACHT domain-containing NTPase [Cellulophaga sp. BC115SP]|uniref:NACHT domain-containing protein n=1 Tax=Cellulophaga sp. BC115SP TaxID=2683263 RepID=UPI0014124B1B|nr:NACHT domain-containing protein [Cellulophaga sp. BC115SP]NBB31633.1 NACHT domain-containing protein [Cellulophaga sp. BC115SP]
MQINWTNIKTEILAETKDILQTEPNINVNEVLDLFVKVLLHPINETDLAGVMTRIPNALQKIFLENLSRLDKNAYFPDVAKIEPYFRKILYIIDNQAYQRVSKSRDGLGSIISILDLNSNNVNFNWTSLSSNQKTHFAEHLIKAYQLRNLESHHCTDWNNAKLYGELRSVLVMFLFATYKHFRSLKLAVEPNDLTDYLQKQKQLFKVWQSRFVHIEGKEEFAEVELYAKEVFEDTDDNSEDDEDFEEIKIAREGKIGELRNLISEKQMVILGEVGMGKSTTLQYLHFNDAQSALQNKNSPIPIYFELKNLTDKDHLEKRIIDRIDKDHDFTLELLKKGAFSICLDGLNEIEKNIKVKIFTQIKNLISDYPNNFYIITSRPQGYNREFDDLLQNRNIPVFVLQKMENKQINEFLEKNGKKVKDYIVTEINANDRLRKIVQTPLMLLMLIAVVEKEGKIPKEKGKIIRAFMFSLYDREQKQIIDFDKDTFHLLLCYLGYQTRDLTGSNSGLDRDEYIFPILEERKRGLGLMINILDFLRKALDLNILVTEDNQYSFTHELYQEYYAAEFIHQVRKING